MGWINRSKLTLQLAYSPGLNCSCIPRWSQASSQACIEPVRVPFSDALARLLSEPRKQRLPWKVPLVVRTSFPRRLVKLRSEKGRACFVIDHLVADRWSKPNPYRCLVFAFGNKNLGHGRWYETPTLAPQMLTAIALQRNFSRLLTLYKKYWVFSCLRW